CSSCPSRSSCLKSLGWKAGNPSPPLARSAIPMSTQSHGKSFLAGILLEPASRSFQAVSPITNEELPTIFHACSLDAVDEALVKAEEAFVTFRKTLPELRAAFLDHIGEEIMALGDALIERAHLETGLPKERIAGER